MMARIEDIRDLVRQLLTANVDPNEITAKIDEAVDQAIQVWANENGWSMWGLFDLRFVLTWNLRS